MIGRNMEKEEIKNFLTKHDLSEGLDWKFIDTPSDSRNLNHTDILLSRNAITVLAEAIDVARNS